MSTLSPICTPRVSDNPIIFCKTYNNDSMIGLLLDALVEDTLLVELESVINIKSSADWTLSEG
jgi:hypothetical protein